MSVESTTWVFKHSPYSGNTFAVHLALGDWANDLNHWELWERPELLAQKSRCSVHTVRRAVATMVEDGLLEVLDPGGGRGKPARFRFLMPLPSQIGQVSDGETYPPGAGNLATGQRETYPSGGSHSLLTQIEHKGTQVLGASAAEREGSLEISVLCTYLQHVITLYREDPDRAPKITKQWRKDFRLLLERGPEGRQLDEPLTPERVHTAIKFVFTALATPSGPNHFCWAGVIQSPGALRRDWDKVYDAGLKIKRAAGLDPLAEFRNRNHAVAAAVGIDPLAEFRRPVVTR